MSVRRNNGGGWGGGGWKERKMLEHRQTAVEFETACFVGLLCIPGKSIGKETKETVWSFRSNRSHAIGSDNA